MTDLPLAQPLAVRILRDVVTATGPEAAGYLQGQLSQDVAGLPVGATARTFVLAPQGKVVAWLRVTRTADDAFLLDTEVGAGQGVFDRLQRFKLRTKVDFDLAVWQAVAVRGPGAEEAVTAAGSVEALVVQAGWPGIEGVDLLGSEVAVPAGIAEGTLDDYERLRVRAGVSAVGAEVDEATIPAELGQWVIDQSVSFTKGCYTGQELVARIDSRGGNVPKPVRGLIVEAPDSDGPEALVGATLTAPDAEKNLGRLTTVVSAGMGRWHALAVASRVLDPGGRVLVHAIDGATYEAQLLALPFPVD